MDYLKRMDKTIDEIALSYAKEQNKETLVDTFYLAMDIAKCIKQNVDKISDAQSLVDLAEDVRGFCCEKELHLTEEFIDKIVFRVHSKWDCELSTWDNIEKAVDWALSMEEVCRGEH